MQAQTLKTLKTLKASIGNTYWLCSNKSQVFFLFDDLQEANKFFEDKPCTALNIFEDKHELEDYLDYININKNGKRGKYAK